MTEKLKELAHEAIALYDQHKQVGEELGETRALLLAEMQQQEVKTVRADNGTANVAAKTVTRCDPEDLDILLHDLREAGAEVPELAELVRVDVGKVRAQLGSEADGIVHSETEEYGSVRFTR